MQSNTFISASALGKVMLRFGSLLLNSGAGTRRVTKNLTRIAKAYGFIAHLDISTRTISISIQSIDDDENTFTGARSIAGLPGVNFRVIAAISSISWDVLETPIPVSDLREESTRIQEIAHYSRSFVIPVVGLAGLSFCFIFGGSWVEMVTTFVATVCGLAIKQLMARKQFNVYLVTFCAALVAALTVGVASVILPHLTFEHAFSTCTLFLIPGVPLIISFIDLLDGYIINGLDRGVNASIHAFAIASGLATILYIFKLS